eukprot:6962010-Prymnesium_polylepis.1
MSAIFGCVHSYGGGGGLLSSLSLKVFSCEARLAPYEYAESSTEASVAPLICSTVTVSAPQ